MEQQPQEPLAMISSAFLGAPLTTSVMVEKQGGSTSDNEGNEPEQYVLEEDEATGEKSGGAKESENAALYQF